jgi:hypothetical protein
MFRVIQALAVGALTTIGRVSGLKTVGVRLFQAADADEVRQKASLAMAIDATDVLEIEQFATGAGVGLHEKTNLADDGDNETTGTLVI